MYDKIYTLTFNYDVDQEATIIDKNYSPPFQLRIDKATRAAFIEDYYGGSTPFLIKAAGKPLQDSLCTKFDIALSREPLRIWLQSLPEDALRALIREGKSRHFAYSKPSDCLLDFVEGSTRSKFFGANYRRIRENGKADVLELLMVYENESTRARVGVGQVMG